MDSAWLVCLPSRSEGLRASHSRPPVAVARSSAATGRDSDVVHHEENGLLVDPDDVDALADALVRLLADRQLAQAYGDAARRTGEEWGVTPGEYAAKVRALVDTVLDG